MQIFIILFMIDLYKDNHAHAFVNFFFGKSSPQKLLTGFLPDFTVTEKSGLKCL